MWKTILLTPLIEVYGFLYISLVSKVFQTLRSFWTLDTEDMSFRRVPQHKITVTVGLKVHRCVQYVYSANNNVSYMF
jgi:hypothetical protein